jgi:hypothetical protein
MLYRNGVVIEEKFRRWFHREKAFVGVVPDVPTPSNSDPSKRLTVDEIELFIDQVRRV